MYLHEYILITTSLVISIGLPVYMLIRNKMVANAIKMNHSKGRVFVLTSGHILLNLFGLLMFAALYISIVQFSNSVTTDLLVLSVIFACLIALIFYGSGIYITSIILEAFTLPQLRHLKQFKTQFIATHLFHGPISHILMFTGYIFAFLLLCLLEMRVGGAATQSGNLILVIAGIVFGLSYAAAQIYNGTAPYQLVAVIIATLLFGLCFVIYPISLLSTSLPLYFASASIAFMIAMLLYISLKIIKGFKINWDESGY